MKKLALIVFATASLSTAHAVIFPTGFFATPNPLRENFDSTIAGNYNAMPVFGIGAVMQRIGIGSLQVQPFLGVNTVPHMLFGNRADVRITTPILMRRFGGYFASGVNGVFSGFATFRFFDAFNNPIGSASVPMTTTFTWVGFQTFPKWRRVEIYGAIPGLQGHVMMDSLRIRPI